jgi:ATP-dependent helicase HrpA
MEQQPILLDKVTITYPENLPVSLVVAPIKELIKNNQIIILSGETGSGKTTQLPKILLEMGLANNGIIGHTQPRKIAAKVVAHRIANELNNHDIVGYKVRFVDKIKTTTKLKIMTDGILLQEIQTDKLLSKYSAIIIDEAHERSLNIDFLLGHIKKIVSQRPELKVIITSATMHNKKIANFFNQAPIYEVMGKSYPVDIVYQPLASSIDDNDGINQTIAKAILTCFDIELGNVLVFLAGEREIKECIKYLRKTSLRNYQILPFYSRQSEADQALIFNNSGSVKIIIATNVAETSLTIPGIRYVVDSGEVKIKRYNFRTKVEQLQIENISQASAKQRSGRAGRVSHGMCVRLYSEQEYNSFSEYTDPEIIRSNIANVILKIIAFKLGDPNTFPFIEKPDEKSFNTAYRTLFQLNAIDENSKLTQIGYFMIKIPLDCYLARMLYSGYKLNCLKELLIIISYLSVTDPREYPSEFQQLAQDRHRIWNDKKSDFSMILNMWAWYQEQIRQSKSKSKLQQVLQYHFLSGVRAKNWLELYQQIKEILHNNKIQENDNEANYATIHQAVLAGLLTNIGKKDLVENYYLGTNDKKFFIHPSSGVDKAKWIVSSQLVLTTKLYARINASIEPEWIVELTKHLVKYSYSNEHWSKKRGEVIATQNVLFYGLIIAKKDVSYMNINLDYAHDIFIKQGLVPFEVANTYKWMRHNQEIINKLEQLEDKFRLSFFMIEDVLYNFYSKNIPSTIADIRSFEQWLNQDGNDKKIMLNEDKLLEELTHNLPSLQQFPEILNLNGIEIKLKYIVDPEVANDGVTAIINLVDLNLIEAKPFSWLVSGLIREKILFLIKSLPKNIRINLNPVNDIITEFLTYADNNTNEDLHVIFAAFLFQNKKIKVNSEELQTIVYPSHLRFHYEVWDHNQLIASDDDLNLLKNQLSQKLSNIIAAVGNQYEISNIKSWINELALILNSVELKRGNKIITGFYALTIKDKQINLEIMDDLDKAKSMSQRGFFALIKLQLDNQIKHLKAKQFINFKQAALFFNDVYQKEQLLTDSINQIIKMNLNLNTFPKNNEEFNLMVDNCKRGITEATRNFSNVLYITALNYNRVKLKINNHNLQDAILMQLDDLIYPEFLQTVKFSYFEHYPRYLDAVLIRLDKYEKSKDRDMLQAQIVDQIYEAWYNYVDYLELNNLKTTAEIYNFKFKIEELRVSLFAETLKTPFPVSSKRLWRELEQFPGFLSLK